MGNVEYIRHRYKVTKALKTYCVYSLIGSSSGTPLLPDTIRIEKYNGYSKATSINYYLRIRNTTNWQTCEKVTGLRPTGRKLLFEGNWLKDGKKSLLLFEFTPQPDQLIIDVYRAFYPYHRGLLTKIANNHLSGL